MSMVSDFHSHILPGIDDGSATVEESIRMLQLETEQGIRHVVATPHFYAHSDSPKRFLKKREEAEALHRQAMSLSKNMPQLSIGAEVYYFRGISESEVLKDLSFFNKKCILIEMPTSPWQPYMYQELEDIRTKRGIIPVIAHVDRYIGPFRSYGIPQRLEQMPVAVQANASFFLDRLTRRMAIRMLREERIHILGSDCHNLSSRSPNLGSALKIIEKELGSEIFQKISDYQKILIDNTYIIGDNKKR